LFEQTFRVESGRVLAALISRLGDIETGAGRAARCLNYGAATLGLRMAHPVTPAHGSQLLHNTKPLTAFVATAASSAAMICWSRCLPIQTDDEDMFERGIQDERLKLMFTCCPSGVDVGGASRIDIEHARRTLHRGSGTRLFSFPK